MLDDTQKRDVMALQPSGGTSLYVPMHLLQLFLCCAGRISCCPKHRAASTLMLGHHQSEPQEGRGLDPAALQQAPLPLRVVVW